MEGRRWFSLEELDRPYGTGEKDRDGKTLELENKERAVRVSAGVELLRYGHRLLPQERCRLPESHRLAADRGYIITQALLHIRERMAGR